MTIERYRELRAQLLARADAIQQAKQPAYIRGSADALANFKASAAAAQVSIGQAWVVLDHKHLDAVITAMLSPDVPQAEALEDRFADALNYLTLAWAILHET